MVSLSPAQKNVTKAAVVVYMFTVTLLRRGDGRAVVGEEGMVGEEEG